MLHGENTDIKQYDYLNSEAHKTRTLNIRQTCIICIELSEINRLPYVI